MRMPTDKEMMEMETLMDRMQHDMRKCLGITRKIMEYHKPNRQKTMTAYLDRPVWLKHQCDRRSYPDKVK